MKEVEFKPVPGYEIFSVARDGRMIKTDSGEIVTEYPLNGYLVVDVPKGFPTTTLPVHRAVAIAWVVNPDPSKYTVVNHKDGVPLNNWYENLEWVDHSTNNYHAIENGLRYDNIPCKVRDFVTGRVYSFSSMAQASEFMGLPKSSTTLTLRPKQFGRLVMDRFEFRYQDEPTPWFYENRTERVPPSRYMVVEESDGTIREIYSTRSLLKEYQLYDSPSKAIVELANFANLKYPDKVFRVYDSYSEDQYRILRKTRKSVRISVTAKKGEEVIEFTSLTKCARYFRVDRSSIQNRLNKDIELDGWTFITNDCPAGQ